MTIPDQSVRAVWRLVPVLALLAATSVAAFAHARLDHATPPAGSRLRSAPSEVVIWFTENIESSFSTIRVDDAEGVRVDRGDSRVDPANRKLMRVSLAPLPEGTYKVNWQVLSVDAHRTEGSFEFRIAK
jgi:methionine-rich copper-binding protein CopC